MNIYRDKIEEIRRECIHQISAMDEEIHRLKAENESLRKDAERYRWIRQYTVETLPVAGALHSLDKQIDEAMAKEAK